MQWLASRRFSGMAIFKPGGTVLPSKTIFTGCVRDVAGQSSKGHSGESLAPAQRATALKVKRVFIIPHDANHLTTITHNKADVIACQRAGYGTTAWLLMHGASDAA